MPEPKLQPQAADRDRKSEAAPKRAETGGLPLTVTAYRLKPVTMKIVPASEERRWMDWHSNGAYRCLPLRIANQAGWFLLNDCDFEVLWTGKPHVDSLKIKYPRNQKSRFVLNIFGHGILTWHIPYLFRTPPGYNLVVRGPTNWIKDGVCPLDAIVETDWAVATFTMNWKLTRPLCRVKFRKDEPICMILPQRRGELEAFRPEVRNIESEPELDKGHQEWSDARRQLVGEKKVLAEETTRGMHKAKPAPWQPEYFLGTAPGGAKALEHQIRLEVRAFDEMEAPREAVAAPEDGQPSRERGSVLDRVKRLWRRENS